MCALFAPSDLVWHAHDALADSFMLYDITVTRQKKIQNSTATVGRPPESIQRVFSTAKSGKIGTDHAWSQHWSLKEEQ